MNDKNELRRALRQLCRCFTGEVADASAICVMQKVQQLPCFYAASRIVLFHSLPDELPTADMLQLWSRSKTVLLPRVVGDDMGIVAYHADELATGSFNIMEPTGNEIISSFHSSDVAIVPGVAFDRNCNRLGRGKGYYDRFLASFPGTKIGICADFRLIDAIPAEAHDVKMDYVITPSTTITKQ
ncbi:MAG: 5-formyltetrahydrofolate cyclo-ligase [Muribaculaceae bacterium]